MNGDLEVRVHVKKNPNFERIDIDAHTTEEISIVDAVLGCEVDVKTIYGDHKKVKIEPGTQNLHKVKLNREGFYRPNTQTKGNHVVTIKVKVPTKVT